MTFGNRTMLHLTGKFCFVVTSPAKVHPCCRKKLPGFCRLRMGFCVAGYASLSFHHGMQLFSLHLFLMTSCAKGKFFRKRNSPIEEKESNDNTRQQQETLLQTSLCCSCPHQSALTYQILTLMSILIARNSVLPGSRASCATCFLRFCPFAFFRRFWQALKCEL